MELPVVIFVSAVTGAISSLIVQLIFRKFSVTPVTSPPVVQHTSIPQESIPTPEAIEESTEENKEETSSAESEEIEDVDEANILTSSDISHHVPKLGRFKDLNIPSIDDDSIQVSESKVPTVDESSSEPEENDASEADKPPQAPAVSDISDIESNTVPEHDDIDDDATVLVQRTPPK